MSDYKLPICWLGKSITVIDEETGKMIGVAVTEEMVQPACHCPKEMEAFFCMEGHMTECHAGKTCEEAECSHYESQMDNESGSEFYDENDL